MQLYKGRRGEGGNGICNFIREGGERGDLEYARGDKRGTLLKGHPEMRTIWSIRVSCTSCLT